MEELRGFGMKISLTLPSLANEHFIKLSNENDEPIYAKTDPFMRIYVRQSVKGGRCAASNQYYISSNSDDFFNIMSKQLNFNDNICEILDKYFESTNKHRKRK